MKRIFLIAAFVANFLAFAASASEQAFSAGISLPCITNDYFFDEYDKVRINAVGLNLLYRKLPDDKKYGFFLNADIFLPYSKTFIVDENHTESMNLSDYKYFFGMDFLGGIYTNVFSEGIINIPVGAGLHFDAVMSKEKDKYFSYKESVYTVGLGAWANFEMNPSEKIGVYAGAKLNYDFYYKISGKGKGLKDASDSGNCSGFSVIPAIGVIVKF